MKAYMSVGLPILTMKLTETSRILREWNCGITVETWNEMALEIKHLYNDFAVWGQLSENARKAADQYYNWEVQTERLDEFVSKIY